MTKIFVDFEFNTATKEREILQIGAVKMNENNEIISEFSSYVKPIWAEVTSRTTKLTGIKQYHVQNAEELGPVLEEFFFWLGEDFDIIYSWSMADFFQLKEECSKKKIYSNSLVRVMEVWKDYQREFGDAINYSGLLSLKNAILALDAVFSGTQHSALDDAKNTALLFALAHDVHKKEVLDSIKEWFAPKEELTFCLGEVFQGIALNV